MSQRQPLSEPPTRKSRVAIVGTGLAGLTTAYLLGHDDEERYDLTLFEQADKLALDAASVSLRDKKTDTIERVDVPPRSFCRGYYNNLCRMFDHLGVAFQPIKLTWIFTKAPIASSPPIHDARDVEAMPGRYFVYGKRLRELLLLSPYFWLAPSREILQTICVAICHVWFYVACFLVMPRGIQPKTDSKADLFVEYTGEVDEPFRQYLQRIRLPQKYVHEYLLPVLSVICSCSHHEMMGFPASDVVNFIKGSFLRRTYVVQGGINRVQSALCKGMRDVRLRAQVTEIVRVDGRVRVSWEGTEAGQRVAYEEFFDRVVLAVAPNVAATLFKPAQAVLFRIPTAPVTTSFLSRPSGGVSVVDEDSHIPPGKCSYRRGDTQLMAFRTSFSDKATFSESFHVLPSGLVVRTSPSACMTRTSGSLYTYTFTRTLRNAESRHMMQGIMERTQKTFRKDLCDEKDTDSIMWTNGMDNVWIAGSWCWDGMVVLEGCVVSAMKVAEDFGVAIPWQ